MLIVDLFAGALDFYLGFEVKQFEALKLLLFWKCISLSGLLSKPRNNHSIWSLKCVARIYFDNLIVNDKCHVVYTSRKNEIGHLSLCSIKCHLTITAINIFFQIGSSARSPLHVMVPGPMQFPFPLFIPVERPKWCGNKPLRLECT